MTDVRLTALNPEDSLAYPVACNSSGELLVEKSGSSEYVRVIGDNMTGDLTFDTDKIVLGVDGNVTFAGELTVNNTVSTYRATDTATSALFKINSDVGGINQRQIDFRANGDAFFSGSGTFNGNATFGGTTFAGTTDGGVTSTTSFASRFYNNSLFPTLYVKNSGNGGLWQGVNSSGTQTSFIASDGSSSFANGKAGFTAEGYLFCTTRSGEKVILDSTSDGVGQWVAYSTFRDQIEDVIEEGPDRDQIEQTIKELKQNAQDSENEAETP